MQFLLFTGCLPGLLGVLLNCTGSVDELHFEKKEDGSVNMTRYRRHCGAVVKETPIKVQAVGNLEDLDDYKDSQNDSKNSSASPSASNSDSPTNSNNNQHHIENLVVIDGATGAKMKEEHLILNGTRAMKSTFQNASMDTEGDASTIVKAFCNLPLSYEEYSWVEENAFSLLPDMSKMTQKELDLHKIQMLQLTLQRIQGLEEKQALGVVLTPQNLNTMGQRGTIQDQLACLKFDMSTEEIRKIKSMRDGTDDNESDEDEFNQVIEQLVLPYDDGISDDEDD